MMVDDESIIRKALRYELNEMSPVVDCCMNDRGVVETKVVEMVDTFDSGNLLMNELDKNPDSLPDYLLVDMEFRGEPTGGLFITKDVSAKYPSIKVIILSGRFDNPVDIEVNRTKRIQDICRVVFDALAFGAKAFVSKNAAGGFSVDNIVRAIACLERGEMYYFNYPVMVSLKEAAELYMSTCVHNVQNLELSEVEKQILILEAAGYTAQEIANTVNGNESDKSVQDKQKELSRKLNIVNKSGARVAKAFSMGLINVNDVDFLKK